jgi:hypothetical protein
MLLESGSSSRYPGDPGDAHLRRLRRDASSSVLLGLPEELPGA